MVSSNLLSISSYPTVMNTSIKQPQMINPGQDFIFIRQNTQPGGLEVHTTDAVIQVDTTEARESMGLGQLSDASMIKMYVNKGYQVAAEATRQAVQDGDAVERNRTTQAQLAKAHDPMLNMKDVETVFYPAVPAQVHVIPGETTIDHHPTEVNISWENTDIVPYQLDRGTVSFDIVQRAYVDITYLGEPMFFPDPNFQSWA